MVFLKTNFIRCIFLSLQHKHRNYKNILFCISTHNYELIPSVGNHIKIKLYAKWSIPKTQPFHFHNAPTWGMFKLLNSLQNFRKVFWSFLFFWKISRILSVIPTFESLENIFRHIQVKIFNNEKVGR